MKMLTGPLSSASVSIQAMEAITGPTRSKWFNCDTNTCRTVVVGLSIRLEGGRSNHRANPIKTFQL